MCLLLYLSTARPMVKVYFDTSSDVLCMLIIRMPYSRKGGLIYCPLIHYGIQFLYEKENKVNRSRRGLWKILELKIYHAELCLV